MANQSLITDADKAAVMAAAVATGLFVSLCTIQEPAGTYSASGQPTGSYTPVSGLTDLPCMDAPQPANEIKVGATEDVQLAYTAAKAIRHILLDDYYATLIEGWREGWRALIDSITYDINGVECDSQRTQTRMQLRRVTL